VSDASDARRTLVKTRWVHVDGDDTEHGAVFRDAGGDVPLSRRPKEFLEFSEDGTVRRLATGADDRAQEVDRAKWSDEGGRVRFDFAEPDAHGRRSYHVVDHAIDRLIVRRD
jgi:hypothetical protein